MGPISMFDAAMMAVMVGWPGLVLGALVGAVVWPKARMPAAVIVALVGLVVAIPLRLAL